MNRPHSGPSSAVALPVPVPVPVSAPGAGATARSGDASRVLQNTYGLLAMTLLFSAGVAALGVAMQWPAPGLLLSLGGGPLAFSGPGVLLCLAGMGVIARRRRA